MTLHTMQDLNLAIIVDEKELEEDVISYKRTDGTKHDIRLKELTGALNLLEKLLLGGTHGGSIIDKLPRKPLVPNTVPPKRIVIDGESPMCSWSAYLLYDDEYAFLDTSFMTILYSPRYNHCSNYSTIWRFIPVKGSSGYKMENFITTSAYLQVEDTEEPTIKFIYFSDSNDYKPVYFEGSDEYENMYAIYLYIQSGNEEKKKYYIVPALSAGIKGNDSCPCSASPRSNKFIAYSKVSSTEACIWKVNRHTDSPISL